MQFSFVVFPAHRFCKALEFMLEQADLVRLFLLRDIGVLFKRHDLCIYLIDRRQSLLLHGGLFLSASIAEQLAKGFVNADDAINRTLEIYYDRIRLGYTTEVYKGFLQVNARNVPGTFLRYGAVASVFVSNDGNDVLWLQRTADGGFVWNNVSEDFAMRTALKDVMKVAEGKTAPRLVSIPVSIPKEGL